MIHIGLFEGIGGFSLAAGMAGWETLVTCEINPLGLQVLKHYWPCAYHHGDIKTLTYDTINAELSARYGTAWRKEPVIITGGFPCQPYSVAGKRRGKEDDRLLWPEMLRVIREVSPEWVVGENVFGLVNWDGGLVFDEVQSDLEAAGYEVQPFILPACGVNAPHKRERVWFVAHRTGELQQRNEARECGNKRRENVQQEYREANPVQSGTMGENGITTHSASKQGEWHGLEQCEVGEQEQIEFGGNNSRMDNGGIDAHPDNEGLEGVEKQRGIERGRAQRKKYFTGFFQSAWENFPTQYPVCGRNDGVPSGLVGITVSKHRTESLKAYGNAIVPHVVYQIFKVINQMTTNERMD